MPSYVLANQPVSHPLLFSTCLLLSCSQTCGGNTQEVVARRLARMCRGSLLCRAPGYPPPVPAPSCRYTWDGTRELPVCSVITTRFASSLFHKHAGTHAQSLFICHYCRWDAPYRYRAAPYAAYPPLHSITTHHSYLFLPSPPFAPLPRGARATASPGAQRRFMRATPLGCRAISPADSSDARVPTTLPWRPLPSTARLFCRCAAACFLFRFRGGFAPLHCCAFPGGPCCYAERLHRWDSSASFTLPTSP